MVEQKYDSLKKFLEDLRKIPILASIWADDTTAPLADERTKIWSYFVPKSVNTNHHVIIVGIVPEPKTHENCLLIRQSWGIKFGKDGYVYLPLSIFNEELNPLGIFKDSYFVLKQSKGMF